MASMLDDTASRLTLYADAITAFVTAQLIGFIYLLAHGDCFARNVLHRSGVPIVVSILCTEGTRLWCTYATGDKIAFSIAWRHLVSRSLARS
jgi:hypothetical protein